MSPLAWVLLSLAAQDGEAVALTNLKVITVAKGNLESGVIVVQAGKIAAVGADAKVPEGARVVDCRGLVAFPGLVHAYSRLGLLDFPASSGVTPQHMVFDEINPVLDAFSQPFRYGVTTLVLLPAGTGIVGQGAVVKPTGRTRQELVVEKSAVLRIVLLPGSAGKEALRQALEGARKAIDAEKKPSAPKMDEKTAVIARFLKGDLPAFVEVPGASELLHFWQVMEPYADLKLRIVLACPPDAFKAAPDLGTRKARVILRPAVSLAPFTRERINTAAELSRVGVDVALVPMSDASEALQGWLFRLAELVKCGLPREVAFRAVTLAPAEMAGIENRVGSIEVGKDADILLFNGDPLSAQTRLREVYLNGISVFRGE